MKIAQLRTIPDMVRQAQQFGPSLAFSQLGMPERRLTFHDLNDRVERGARKLRARHATPGAAVLLLLESSPHWPAAFFSILRAGHVVVPLPIDVAPESVASIAAFADARAVIYSDGTQRFVSSLAGLDAVVVNDLFDGTGPACALPGVDGEALALLAFTSGSTGRPRAVELTHRNLLSNLTALLAIRQADPGDAVLSMLPPAHLFELVVGLLAPVACGVHVVYAGSLLPNRLLAALRGERITHSLAVPALATCLYQEVLDGLVETGVVSAEGSALPAPAILERLREQLDPSVMRHLRSAVRSRLGSTFKTLVVGGAAFDGALAAIIAAIGIRVEVGYGLTEAGPVVSVGVVGECPAGSVGRPLPGVEVSISPNGEILVRGPGVMRGYWRDPEATAQALADGWLHTGDHGRLDAAGNLFVVGRLKETIVTSAGRTIYPEEVEPYYRSSLFAEFCAVGLPGSQGNDVPTLVVTAASPGICDEELQVAFAALRSAAPPNCRLERIVRLTEPLPRTALGKIGRRKVVERILTGNETELRALLAKLSKVSLDSIGVDDDLVAKLGLDSLSGLRLLAAVEKRFAFRIPDQRLSEFRTMRQILDLLHTARTGSKPCASV
jgi:long-chain acyl-CoA synthetase